MRHAKHSIGQRKKHWIKEPHPSRRALFTGDKAWDYPAPATLQHARLRASRLLPDSTHQSSSVGQKHEKTPRAERLRAFIAENADPQALKLKPHMATNIPVGSFAHVKMSSPSFRAATAVDPNTFPLKKTFGLIYQTRRGPSLARMAFLSPYLLVTWCVLWVHGLSEDDSEFVSVHLPQR